MIFRLAAALVAVVVVSGCADPALVGRIVVPLRICAVKGTALTDRGNGEFLDTGTDAGDNAILGALTDLNNKIWIPGANISFLSQEYNGASSPFHFYAVISVASASRLGDVRVSSRDAGELAKEACLSAWSFDPGGQGSPARTPGIIVILARELVSDDFGTPSISAGVNPGHTKTASRNNGNDLCVEPRHLIPDDVAVQYVVVPEPERFGLGLNRRDGVFYQTLAHELGHALLLAHGDGLDNDANGALPPGPGLRKFDQDCDPQEYATFDSTDQGGLSIMREGCNSGGSACNVITILQRELARESAAVVAGHVGNPP